MTIESPSVAYKIGKIKPLFFGVGFVVSMIALGIVGYDVQWYIAAGQGDSPSGTPYFGLGDSGSLLAYRIILVVMLCIIVLGIAGYLSRRHYRRISDKLV